jgi:hypothetical protein
VCGLASTKAYSTVSQPGVNRTFLGVLQEIDKRNKNLEIPHKIPNVTGMFDSQLSVLE